MKNTDESILVTQTLNGDTTAFANLVDMHKAMVFNIVIKILQSREEAEECTQDVFIKIYQSLASFKGEAKFSTWLYRIAFNTAISQNRKKKWDTAPLDENITYSLTDDDIYTKFETWTADEQRIAIDKAISALPPDDAVIVTLFYMEEKSIEEVAYITEYSKANVKVRLHRARKKLHEQLDYLMNTD